MTIRKSLKGSQPIISIDEMEECERAVINDPSFKEVLKRLYNINDTSLVMVDIWSAGNYGSEEDSSKRLTRPLCFLRKNPDDNGYAHPLEGVRPVDLNIMKVIRVEEYGSFPIPPNDGNYSTKLLSETFRTG